MTESELQRKVDQLAEAAHAKNTDMNEESIYQELERLSEIHAEAKANRVYLTEFRKSKKALLMKRAAVENPSISAAKAEVYAYSHQEYQDLLRGLQAATEKEAINAHKIEVINMKFDAWRSRNSLKRAEIGLR